MTYTIPLHPDCLDWVAQQPVQTQALLGYTLSQLGIPRRSGETNYDVTVEDLEHALTYHWGPGYRDRAEGLSFYDSYDFIPAYPYWAMRVLTIFYKALPFIAVFLLGLACGMDF